MASSHCLSDEFNLGCPLKVSAAKNLARNLTNFVHGLDNWSSKDFQSSFIVGALKKCWIHTGGYDGDITDSPND